MAEKSGCPPYFDKQKIRAFYLTAALLVFCFPSRGVIQYRPVSSLERHEIAGGGGANKTLFLDYSLYFPEITAILSEPWKRIGVVGLSAGGTLLPKDNRHCGAGAGGKKTPLFAHVGFKVRVSYFEKILPFMEYGLSRAGCVMFDQNKDPKYFPALRKTQTYFSLGLNLSFKIIDRKSIYSLDQDYGLNDMGIRAQCRWYYGTKEPVFICSAGLSLLF